MFPKILFQNKYFADIYLAEQNIKETEERLKSNKEVVSLTAGNLFIDEIHTPLELERWCMVRQYFKTALRRTHTIVQQP